MNKEKKYRKIDVCSQKTHERDFDKSYYPGENFILHGFRERRHLDSVLETMFNGSSYYLDNEINTAPRIIEVDYKKLVVKVSVENGEKNSRVPLKIERKSDGDILKLNEDGKTYSFVKDRMHRPYKYTFDRLFHDERCEGEFRIIKWGKAKK